jgi:protease I
LIEKCSAPVLFRILALSILICEPVQDIIMAQILVVLPDTDVDPTEVAVPWYVLTQAGHDVAFATQSGRAAVCDQITLTGQGLPAPLQFLKCRPENAALYRAMAASVAYIAPNSWEGTDPSMFDGLLLPGGHAPGMRPYIRSPLVHDICASFMERMAPVGAICHGVMALALARLEDGRPVLEGYKTTGLTQFQERAAILLTAPFVGDHYKTFGVTVQQDVSAALAKATDFEKGPAVTRYGSQEHPDRGFIVKDRNYISARWPGDAWKFANAFKALVAD